MANSSKREWWITAALGGAICGIFGPLLGVVVFFLWAAAVSAVLHLGSPDSHELLQSIGIVSLSAEIMFGVPGLVLGCCGGLVLKLLAARRPSANLMKMGITLGVGLGSLVPLWLLVLFWKLWKTLDDFIFLGIYVLLGAFIGMLCGIVLTRLLRSRRLLETKTHESLI